MDMLYVVTIQKERMVIGEESVIVRIVRPTDLEDFLFAYARDNDTVNIKQVKVYGEV